MARLPKLRWITRGAIVRVCVIAALLVVLGCRCLSMPGQSYRGPLPPLDRAGASLRDALRSDVETLATGIGERNVFRPAALVEAAAFLEDSLKLAGYRVTRDSFKVAGCECVNLEVQLYGADRPEQIVVVGAHYDSVHGTPGANDNATGTAAVLALARSFAGRRLPRTLRFVFFVNEEPPFFQTEDMGSMVYARRCGAKKEQVVAMLSLETIGFYSDARGSQHYPFPFGLLYPSKGDFVGFVGNLASRDLVRECVGTFRRDAKFPSQGAAMPEFVREAGFSDHWAFWQQGCPAVMVTDTAFLRYPHYHTAEDTPDKIDYDRLSRVVTGLGRVVERLSATE